MGSPLLPLTQSDGITCSSIDAEASTVPADTGWDFKAVFTQLMANQSNIQLTPTSPEGAQLVCFDLVLAKVPPVRAVRLYPSSGSGRSASAMWTAVQQAFAFFQSGEAGPAAAAAAAAGVGGGGGGRLLVEQLSSEPGTPGGIQRRVSAGWVGRAAQHSMAMALGGGDCCGRRRSQQQLCSAVASPETAYGRRMGENARSGGPATRANSRRM
jgi:hypothetical protein